MELTMSSKRFTVNKEQAEQTVSALVRSLVPGTSWTQVRRLIDTRRVKIGGDLCLDPARRVHEGEVFEFLERSAKPPSRHDEIVIRHLDAHIVVAEKPAGI